MDGKFKVSFGIKTSKQASLPKKPPSVNNDVEYIKSFDSSCKPMSLGEVAKGDELVIPSRGNQMKGGGQMGSGGMEEGKGGGTAGAAAAQSLSSLSLDQLAAQELLKDAKGAELLGVKSVDVVPLPEDKQDDAVEATLEDYESIPVEDFGKAMLRGMGWEPGKGIGKNQRVVSPSAPQLRPKGLGLGADRVTPQSANQPPGSRRQGVEGEEANITIGCGVQIVAGGHGGLYGKVVSHNEDTGRCIVKLEIGGSCVSVNGSLVRAVAKEEYASNCRVLNAAKYKRYKESSDERLQAMREEAAGEAEEKQPSSERRRRHRSRSPHK